MTGISQACSRNHPRRELCSDHRQPFISLSSSSEIERRLRYTSSTIARPDADLGGGDGDDVEREHLTVDVAVHQGEGDRLRLTALRISSTDISTMHGVLAGDDAVHADAEQHRAEQEEVGGVARVSPCGPGRWRRWRRRAG